MLYSYYIVQDLHLCVRLPHTGTRSFIQKNGNGTVLSRFEGNRRVCWQCITILMYESIQLATEKKKELFPTVSLVALVFYCTAALYRNSQQILKAHGCSRCKQNTWYRNTQQYKLLDTMHTNIFRQTAESWTSMWNGKWFWMMLQAMTVHWLVRMMFLSFYFVYQTSRRIRKTVEKKTRKKREKNM